jgi:dTMP kinase
MSLFISIEGPDGSGKTTQIEKLASLANQNNWLLTKNPGGSPLGLQIRKILLEDQSLKVLPIAELLLYMADRAQHVAEVITPALAAGKTVICDRYIDSTVAYQGYARGLDLKTIHELNQLATQNLKPNLTFLLDVSPAVGLQRASVKHNGGHDKLEAEGLEFQAKVRAGFLELAKQEPERFVVINTETLDPEQVHQQILKTIEGLK